MNRERIFPEGSNFLMFFLRAAMIWNYWYEFLMIIYNVDKYQENALADGEYLVKFADLSLIELIPHLILKIFQILLIKYTLFEATVTLTTRIWAIKDN
jgi:hypothetical protein